MSEDARPVAFVKGHGTENDFVLLPDPHAELDLTPQRVRRLCDRSRGLGADGVLRVVPATAMAKTDAVMAGGAAPEEDQSGQPEGEWFMDYRNADGSVAEMCGNGLRLFARYLVHAGLVTGTDFTVDTRSERRAVRVAADGSVAVGMGPVRLGEQAGATVQGQVFSGRVVDVGNPHLVCELPADGAPGEAAALLQGMDLSRAPQVADETFPEGVNVEFTRLLAREPDLVIAMRVHERGVGETRSCGTGTVAAAAVALQRFTGDARGRMRVQVPGGAVTVDVADDDSVLTGPTELVAAGELDPSWWQRANR